MIGEKQLEYRPLTLSEVKELLSARKKAGELNYEQDIAFKYAKKFSKLTAKQEEKVRQELSAIESITPELAVKIIDIMPTAKEVLELLLTKETQLSAEDTSKVLEITQKYAKA